MMKDRKLNLSVEKVMELGMSTGHADTVQMLLDEVLQQVIERQKKFERMEFALKQIAMGGGSVFTTLSTYDMMNLARKALKGD